MKADLWKVPDEDFYLIGFTNEYGQYYGAITMRFMGRPELIEAVLEVLKKSEFTTNSEE